jgi:hypothetical protein
MALNQTVQSSVSLYANARYAGQIDTLQVNNVTDAILDTAVAGFGVPLARTSAGVKPFTLVGDAFVGFAVRKHTVMNSYNSTTSPTYEIGDSVAILNMGYIVVEAESDVTKGGSVFIRFGTGTGATNVLGSVRADADATGGVGEDEATAVEVSGAIFAESASAGELVRVAVTRIYE